MKSLWLGAALICTLACPLRAQVRGFGPKQGGERIRGFGRNAVLAANVSEADRRAAQSTFSKYDRDRSGVLDPREITQTGWTVNIVRQYDLNGDGRIPLEEMTLRWTKYRLQKEAADRRKKRLAKPKKKPSKPASGPTRPPDPLQTYRSNYCSTLASELIGLNDRNGNKQLESNEWRRSGSRFGNVAGADSDGNRIVTHTELWTWLKRRLPPLTTARLANSFRVLDADADGQVSMREFTDRWTDQNYTEFRALDRNDDGVISAKESHAAPTPRGALSFASNRVQVLNQRAEIVSKLWINRDVQIKDLDVRLSLAKNNDMQTRITLIGPDDQQVLLFEGGWLPWNTISIFDGVLIDDEAPLITTTLPQPPIMRRLRSDGLKAKQTGLNHYYGKSAHGSWKLVVRNLDNNVGVLHHWSLWVTPRK